MIESPIWATSIAPGSRSNKRFKPSSLSEVVAAPLRAVFQRARMTGTSSLQAGRTLGATLSKSRMIVSPPVQGSPRGPRLAEADAQASIHDGDLNRAAADLAQDAGAKSPYGSAMAGDEEAAAAFPEQRFLGGTAALEQGSEVDFATDAADDRALGESAGE